MNKLCAVLLSFSVVFSENKNDNLIDQIIESATGKAISKTTLIERMHNSDVIYLGEKHDNGDHHDHQLEIIESLIENGLTPIIGFEFFYQHQTSDIIKFVKGAKSPFHYGEIDSKKEETKLREKLGWNQRSDEDWDFYFAFIKIAKEHGLNVFGADLSSGIISRISREGIESLSPVEINQLSPTMFENENYESLMVEKFKDSHCGWVPKDNFKKLYQTWVARNDAMAYSIVKMAGLNRPIIIIVGGGHVEHNMGIYERVHYLNPKLNQLNVGFTEVNIKEIPLINYFETPQINEVEFLPNHEYYWFTRRKDDNDPCENFNY
jgi:uncharacterized iron-regulated protein